MAAEHDTPAAELSACESVEAAIRGFLGTRAEARWQVHALLDISRKCEAFAEQRAHGCAIESCRQARRNLRDLAATLRASARLHADVASSVGTLAADCAALRDALDQAEHLENGGDDDQ